MKNRAGCDDVAAGFFYQLHVSLNYICTEKIKPIEAHDKYEQYLRRPGGPDL